MSERFMDKILQFMGIQEEDEEDEQAAADDEVEYENSRPLPEDEPRRRKGRLVSLPARDLNREQTGGQTPVIAAVPGIGGGRMRMVVMEPESFDEVQTICDHLKERRPVIVSVEGLDKELSKRIVDFVSGTTYAIDGNIQRVGESIFVFAPNGVQIEAALRTNWEPSNDPLG